MWMGLESVILGKVTRERKIQYDDMLICEI